MVTFNYFFDYISRVNGFTKVSILITAQIFTSNIVLGQCPENSNIIYNFVSNVKSGVVADWANNSIWNTSFFNKNKTLPSVGKVNKSVAINGDVVLHNKGLSIDFNQPFKICGSLKIEGNLIVSGACSPLNIYGKLVVLGDLDVNQPIVIWPGAELIVYGNLNIRSGSSPIVMGKLAVKGNIEDKYGLNIYKGALVVAFGSYSSLINIGIIDGNLIVYKNLMFPMYGIKLGFGNVYCFGLCSKFIFYNCLKKADLQRNYSLYSSYLIYQNIFFPKPSKYIDLQINYKSNSREYTISGCVIDSTIKYHTSERKRVFIDSETKNRVLYVKFLDRNFNDYHLEINLNDSLFYSNTKYYENGVMKLVDKLYVDENEKVITINLRGNVVNDLVISGLVGNRKIDGEKVIISNIGKEDITSISVYKVSDLNKPIVVVSSSNIWDGNDKDGNELQAGVYLLNIVFKNGQKISGQFLVK